MMSMVAEKIAIRVGYCQKVVFIWKNEKYVLYTTGILRMSNILHYDMWIYGEKMRVCAFMYADID